MMKRFMLSMVFMLPLIGIAATANAAEPPLGQSVRALIAAQTLNPLAGQADPEALPPTEGAHTNKVVSAYQQKAPANAKTASARGALTLGSGK